LLTANRKLIRPSLQTISDHSAQGNGKPNQGSSASQAKKGVPQESTNAENYYYVKQMQSRTPMVVVLSDGEAIHGIVEWYDRNCIKVNRDDAPNLLIYKSHIKYLYKQDED
jgi:host factor-I protein